VGKGLVGIARLVETPGKAGFRGPPIVARETEGHDDRIGDLAEGVQLHRAPVRA
jgi:hypothetical protein